MPSNSSAVPYLFSFPLYKKFIIETKFVSSDCQYYDYITFLFSIIVLLSPNRHYYSPYNVKCVALVVKTFFDFYEFYAWYVKIGNYDTYIGEKSNER